VGPEGFQRRPKWWGPSRTSKRLERWGKKGKDGRVTWKGKKGLRFTKHFLQGGADEWNTYQSIIPGKGLFSRGANAVCKKPEKRGRGKKKTERNLVGEDRRTFNTK